ncbi:hypothetical protein BELL_0593g00060 [Botrytis elliptica]|uniref:Uncharacterized protein n=1 Tax=Botrytis elliptica TaxID=278938 RepID=A0A4Z1JCM3_9HELO|nr:hypothetical protein EAE99_000083 [Botrytis elliptica]TGO71318.1 hypothetical protein BELL_0593g00060 [Botrytis elliptica]
MPVWGMALTTVIYGLYGSLGAKTSCRLSPFIKDHFIVLDDSVATRQEDESLKALGKHGRKCMSRCLFSTTADTGAPGHTKDEFFTVEASLLVVAGTNTTAVAKVGFCFYVLGST